jgi:NADH dehydrogenase FAD-containing subunit
MAIFSDKVRMYARFILYALPLIPGLLLKKIRATLHRWTYKETSNPKNVVIIGGSFAGWFTAQELITSLPTGWKVILIEKNEHLHYVFNFPRFSVLTGKEQLAFIPYDGLDKIALPGIYERKRATATKLGRNRVVLDDGEEVDFEYCIIATGASQPFPGRLATTSTEDSCAELRSVQKQVEHAQKIAVVGSGAVGVEMATDIKAYYSEKDVTLYSSRDHVLTGFGAKLRDSALDAMHRLGVHMVLNARPVVQGKDGRELRFADGRVEQYDLVVSSVLGCAMTYV